MHHHHLSLFHLQWQQHKYASSPLDPPTSRAIDNGVDYGEGSLGKDEVITVGASGRDDILAASDMSQEL